MSGELHSPAALSPEAGASLDSLGKMNFLVPVEYRTTIPLTSFA